MLAAPFTPHDFWPGGGPTAVRYAVLMVLIALFVALVYGDVIPTVWRGSDSGVTPLVTGVKTLGRSVGDGFQRAADQF